MPKKLFRTIDIKIMNFLFMLYFLSVIFSFCHFFFLQKYTKTILQNILEYNVPPHTGLKKGTCSTTRFMVDLKNCTCIPDEDRLFFFLWKTIFLNSTLN